MGGNVTALMKNGTSTRAEKIPLKDIGRQKFMQVIQELLLKINKDFDKKFGHKIWNNTDEIKTGYVFNGSTSFIMNPQLIDNEVTQYKPLAGDIDVTVPNNLKEEVWKYLDGVEDTFITKSAKYMGSNKPTVSSIGDQINTVFLCNFGEITCACQIDFEFLEYENDKPTEWAKFSHSSSFEDAKIGVKSVHHKYILRALVGGSSIRRDIIIATGASTPDNIKLSKSKVHEIPKMLKFSVARGIRTAYEPMLDANGEQIILGGKKVYKEIPSKTSTYVNSVKEMFKLSFGDVDEKDEPLFFSFDGMCKLIKKYLTKEQIKNTYNRYVELLWGVKPQRAQELEVQNPELDFQVKYAGYKYFCDKLGFADEHERYVETYYADYGHRGHKLGESFADYLEKIGVLDDFI